MWDGSHLQILIRIFEDGLLISVVFQSYNKGLSGEGSLLSSGDLGGMTGIPGYSLGMGGAIYLEAAAVEWFNKNNLFHLILMNMVKELIIEKLKVGETIGEIKKYIEYISKSIDETIKQKGDGKEKEKGNNPRRGYKSSRTRSYSYNPVTGEEFYDYED